MLSLKIFRDRDKTIEAEADALAEKHGLGAGLAARNMERQANNLSAALFWRAVGKALSRRKIEEAVDVLPPTRTHNCLTCLAERFSGTHESETSLPAACIACVAGRLRGGSHGRIPAGRAPTPVLSFENQSTESQG
jgi:hypothetical protein